MLMEFIKGYIILKEVVMNWYKINIKNISENKYVQNMVRWIGNLLLVIAGVSIIFNFVGDYSYNLHQNKGDYLGKLLSYRNSVTIIFTFVWLLSLFLNKKIMVIVWLIAFSQAYMASLKVQELCEMYAEEYCADNNCEVETLIKQKSLCLTRRHNHTNLNA